MACITISSTSKPSSRKKPRSLATKKGMEVVLRAAKPMRTRVSLPGLSAENAVSVMAGKSVKETIKKMAMSLFMLVTSSSQLRYVSIGFRYCSETSVCTDLLLAVYRLDETFSFEFSDNRIVYDIVDGDFD